MNSLIVHPYIIYTPYWVSCIIVTVLEMDCELRCQTTDGGVKLKFGGLMGAPILTALSPGQPNTCQRTDIIVRHLLNGWPLEEKTWQAGWGSPLLQGAHQVGLNIPIKSIWSPTVKRRVFGSREEAHIGTVWKCQEIDVLIMFRTDGREKSKSSRLERCADCLASISWSWRPYFFVALSLRFCCWLMYLRAH